MMNVCGARPVGTLLTSTMQLTIRARKSPRNMKFLRTKFCTSRRPSHGLEFIIVHADLQSAIPRVYAAPETEGFVMVDGKEEVSRRRGILAEN
jgi:hypothetical protein